MTWNEFFAWLERNGVHYSPGDLHFEGRGFWFPQPPDLTQDVVGPRPPEPWIHVFKSVIEIEGRAPIQTVDVITSFGVDQYNIEKPALAQAAVERALMAFDDAAGGETFAPPPHRFAPPAPEPEEQFTTMTEPTPEELHELTRVNRENDLTRARARRLEDEAAYKRQKRTAMPDEIMKICGTCQRQYSKNRWLGLPFLGRQKIDADEETGEPAAICEARNCFCGSTLYVMEDVP